MGGCEGENEHLELRITTSPHAVSGSRFVGRPTDWVWLVTRSIRNRRKIEGLTQAASRDGLPLIQGTADVDLERGIAPIKLAGVRADRAAVRVEGKGGRGFKPALRDAVASMVRRSK